MLFVARAHHDRITDVASIFADELVRIDAFDVGVGAGI
jgi:hypothetical protein